ncbi:MAG TPA: ATP-grasp domain-containing protein [Pyrinomonadaceae bacterium]|jgi:biotin carboxylase
MTDWLAFVESNTSGTGRLFARAAAAQGFRPVLLCEDPSRYPYAADDRVDTLSVDTGDASALVAACRRLAADGRLAGVTSSSEYYVAAAAGVARRLGLRGAQAAAVRDCRDKLKQRRQLETAGVEIPRFRPATSVRTALARARELGLPVVVKAASGTGSIGVRLCRTREEVAAHAASLLGRRRDERGRAVPRHILVESVAEGPEYSVETFGMAVVGVTRKYLGPLPDFVEVGHDFPAELSQADAEAVHSIARRALFALGLGWGPAHVELRLTPEGPQIIEVNPRLAGGYIPELVRLASGVDLVSETVRLVAGGEPDLKTSSGRFASIRFLLSGEEGILRGVCGAEKAARLPGVCEVKLYAEPGGALKRRGDFRDRIGHVIACGPTPRAARTAADAALRAVRLQVEPHAPAASSASAPAEPAQEPRADGDEKLSAAI